MTLKNLLFFFTILLFQQVFGQDLLTSKHLTPTKSTHDFGIIKQEDGAVNYDFVVRNTSGEEVLIYDVVPECSCTEPKWSKEKIAPKASSKINVGFNAGHYPGVFEKRITVCTSADTFELKILGKVIPKPLSDVEKAFPYAIGGLRFSKETFAMHSVFDNKIKTKEFMVYNDSNVAITEVKFSNVPKYIQIKLPDSLGPKTQHKIEVSFDPVKLRDYGYITDYIKVNVGEYSTEMAVMANVSPYIPNYTEKERLLAGTLSLDVENELDLGKIKTDSVYKHVIKVQNTGTKNLKIMKIKPACNCITIENDEVLVLKKGEVKEVVILFDTKNRLGKTKKSIYFYSNDPQNPAKVFRVIANVID